MLQLLDVRYLGRCRDKGRGSQAFGWINGEWKAIFPEQVLRDWFEAEIAGEPASVQAQTLYALLGIKKSATNDEVKTAFRRMARQWHPDVCKEPNAHEMFIRIKEAADILQDPGRKARYDAGLAFEASLKGDDNYRQQKWNLDSGDYRAPLRCGAILADVQPSGKWTVVKQILAWEDVVQGDRILVASWPMGANAPLEEWV